MVKLPDPIFEGRTTALMISEIMRDRDELDNKNSQGYHDGLEAVGGYFIPPFQRPAVWTKDQQRRLVESVHLKISIGAVVVTSADRTDPETGLFPLSSDLLIDGQQRMRALKAYMFEGLRVFVGTEYEHAYDELDDVQKRMFRSTPIGYIEIRESNMDSLRDLYNRLNFGGTAHTEDQRA